jgi:hypothetical protein
VAECLRSRHARGRDFSGSETIEQEAQQHDRRNPKSHRVRVFMADLLGTRNRNVGGPPLSSKRSVPGTSSNFLEPLLF